MPGIGEATIILINLAVLAGIVLLVIWLVRRSQK